MNAVPAPLFDEAHQARLNRRAGYPLYNPDRHFVARHAQMEILDRLSLITRRFTTVAVVAPLRADDFIAALAAHADRVIWTPDLWGIPHPVDAIIDYGILHRIDDVCGYLVQAKSRLARAGLLLTVCVGEMTLVPLRHAVMQAESQLCGGIHNRTHPMIARADMAGLMQRAGYRLPVVDSDRLLLSYATLAALVRDLRGMGCTSALSGRSRMAPPRALFASAQEIIRGISPDPDHAERFIVPIDLIYAIGWAEDP